MDRGMRKISEKKYKIILWSALLAVLIINVFYWGIQKEGYFCDEVYSYHYSNQVDFPIITEDRAEKSWQDSWHDSDFFIDYLTISEEEAFDITGVYRSAQKDNHPPVFYTLMEISCSIFSKMFPGTFSKWCGIMINIFFYILSIVVLYKLAKEVLQSDFWAIAVCILYGFSSGAVSTAVFIRMYMLYTFWSLLFAYVNALLWKRLWDRDKDTGIGLYFGLFVTAALGILSHYYFLIYAFFICVVIWGYSLWVKRYRFAVKYALVMAGSLICSYLIYPRMRYDLFSGMRGTEAFQNFKDQLDWKDAFGDFVSVVNAELFGRAGGLLIVLLCGMVIAVFILVGWNIKKNMTDQNSVRVVLEKKEKRRSMEFHVDIHDMAVIQMLFAVVFYMLLMAKIAPYQEDRYIFNIFPLIMLVVVYVARKLSVALRCSRRSEIFMVAVLFVFTVVGYMSSGVNYLYKGTEEKLQTASTYSDLPVFYINYGSTYRACADSVYFAKACYTYPTREENIDGISEAVSELEETDLSRFLVYIDLNCQDISAVIGRIEEELGTGRSRWLFDTEYSAVYIIE